MSMICVILPSGEDESIGAYAAPALKIPTIVMIVWTFQALKATLIMPSQLKHVQSPSDWFEEANTDISKPVYLIICHVVCPL
jgi:hypothetical protein